MKNSWLVWGFIIVVTVTVLIAFNYDSGQNTGTLEDMFAEDEKSMEVEYDFVEFEEAEEIDTQGVAREESRDPAGTSPFVQKAEEAVEETVTAAKTETEEIIDEISENIDELNSQDVSYTIQVASFKDKEKAEEELQKAQKKEYPAFIGSRNLGNKGTWHRIYIGSFESKQEAENYLKKVRKDYSQGFVIAPKNS